MEIPLGRTHTPCNKNTLGAFNIPKNNYWLSHSKILQLPSFERRVLSDEKLHNSAINTRNLMIIHKSTIASDAQHVKSRVRYSSPTTTSFSRFTFHPACMMLSHRKPMRPNSSDKPRHLGEAIPSIRTESRGNRGGINRRNPENEVKRGGVGKRSKHFSKARAGDTWRTNLHEAHPEN